MAASSRLSVGKGVAPFPMRNIVLLHPAGQFLGVGQLVVSVAEFDPAEVQLEPFSDSGITGANLRQRRLRGGIVVQETGGVPCEPRLDSLSQQQVEPTVTVVGREAGRNRDPGGGRELLQLERRLVQHGDAKRLREPPRHR